MAVRVGLGEGWRVGPALGLCQDPRRHRCWRSLGIAPRITQDLQASVPSCHPSSSLWGFGSTLHYCPAPGFIFPFSMPEVMPLVHKFRRRKKKSCIFLLFDNNNNNKNNPSQLECAGIDGVGRTYRRQAAGSREWTAPSFVTNHKSRIIGLPANRERKKQIHHLAPSYLLLLGRLGAGTAKTLVGTHNVVGNLTAASRPKSSSLPFRKINFSPFCPPQTSIFPTEVGQGGLGRILVFQMSNFKIALF